MYTFVTDDKIVVSNFIELNGDTITIHSVKVGHDLLVTGSEKSVKYLYGIIANDISNGKSVINLINIKEHFCLVDVQI